jgi:pyridoxamine 5'-phosphate oxidase
LYFDRERKPMTRSAHQELEAETDDPFALFKLWLLQAEQSEPNDPNAMAVATVDADGMPNVRMVLLKGLDEADALPRGFVFYTNFEGTKGQELLSHPKAALVFHWKSLRRQIRIRGVVSVVSNAEADAYFASRPRQSRIGAWASDQSRPLDSRSTLEASFAKYSMEYAVGDIPRPPHWSGFRITPVEIEFWNDGAFRLHDRIVFRRADQEAAWVQTRLFP